MTRRALGRNRGSLRFCHPVRPLAPLLFAAAVLGCKSPPPKEAERPTPPKRAIAIEGPAPRGPGFRAIEITRAAEIGPYVVRGDPSLAVYGAEPDGFAATVGGVDGFGPPKKLGLPSAGATLVAVRPVRAGALVVSARRSERGYLVEAVVAGADGAPRGPARLLRESPDPILWVDSVATGDGAVVGFGSKTQRGAELRVVAVDALGAPRGAVEIVSQQATAWQLTRHGDHASIVFTTRSAAGQQITVTSIGADGHPLPSLVLRDAAMDPDVDAVALRDDLVVAWAEQGVLTLAVLDGSGKLAVKPIHPVPALRSQALVGLAASGARVLVAWDESRVDPRGGRRIELATLGPDLARVTGRAALSMGARDESAPSIEATQEGFAFLTLARACKKGDPCDAAPIFPTLVRTSVDLDAISSEPVLVDLLGGDAPELAWGLSCKASCAIVAAGPASTLLVDLAGGQGAYRPAARSLASGGPPAADRISSLAMPTRLAAAAAAPTAAGGLVAWVSEHHEGEPPPPLPADVDARAEAEKDRLVKANPARGTPRGAVVGVTPVDARGGFQKTATLSVRAFSPGGVAIAPADDGAIVAWVAKDEGDPQVFLTRVGADGRRKAQAMWTREKGEATDVALARTQEGHLLAWVDGRGGDSEVYASRVDKNLRRTGPDTRLTEAPGGASSVAVRIQGDEAWIAFSDARGAADGAGDPFLARVRLSDGKKLGDETRLASSPAHARSLHFVEVGGEVGVTWIDEPMGGKDPSESKLLVAWLDAKGASKTTDVIDVPGGGPRGLSFSCEGSGCRVAILRSEGDALGLLGARWTKGISSPSLLATLASRGETAHEPMLLGDIVLATDERDDGGQLVSVAARW